MNVFLERIKQFLIARLKEPTTWMGIIALILGLLGKDDVFIHKVIDNFTLIFWGSYVTVSTVTK